MRSEVPSHLAEKLVTAVELDFPAVSNILVSFPEKWELVGSFHRQDDLRVYAAGLPRSQESPRRDQFHGLSPEINLTLKTYRPYKLFEPWPQPVLPMVWDMARQEGRIVKGGRLDVRLQPIAEAQAWTGRIFGVLWECYAYETRRRDRWQEELATFWQAVETDMNVAKIFTHPQDPAFSEGYPDFLAALGYQPDRDFPEWWSKER